MDFARNERGFCVGFAWNLILFSFVREREGYKHHADCTVVEYFFNSLATLSHCFESIPIVVRSYRSLRCSGTSATFVGFIQ